jgi:Undecaprenyl-phosphate galactose phosphotransferase WbaP
VEQRSIAAPEQGSAATLVLAGYERLPAAAVNLRSPVWKRRLVPATLVLSDVLLGILVWEVASVLRGIWGQGALSEITNITNAAAIPAIAVWVTLRTFLGLYPGCGLDSVEQLRRHTYSVLFTLAILAVCALGFQIGDRLSRLLLVLAFLGLLVLAPFARYFIKRYLKKLGLWGKPVVILGYKEAGRNVTELLNQSWTLGYNPVAIFDYHLDVPSGSGEAVDGQQYEKAYESPRLEKFVLTEATDLAREHNVDTAIFAMPNTRREQLTRLITLASVSFQHILVIPNLGGITNSAVVARNLAGTFAVEIKYNLLNPWALRAKRAADVVATLVGGALILPFILVLTLLIYLESGAPVFYVDRRMGQDGKLFPCVKFRTMVPDAEAVLQRILHEDAELREEYAKYHKLRDDPRVSRVGRFLRKTSLDELPQLWNVLRGEMSLVGPRPYLPRESKEIGVTQAEILRVPPGITGPWQVAGRNLTSFSERVQMDAVYIRDWSMWLDIVLLARTARTLLLERGAY